MVHQRTNTFVIPFGINPISISKTTKLRKEIAFLEAKTHNMNHHFRKSHFVKMAKENVDLLERTIYLESALQHEVDCSSKMQ